MARKPKIMIITGYGLNCEAESRYAWETAGATVTLVHLHDLLETPKQLHDYMALMFIGGFSYGDHMGSGHVFAQRLKHRLQPELKMFIATGKLILGVCNGFQIMTKIGLLPALDGDYFSQSLAITQNDCGTFQNFWVDVALDQHSPCVFTKGLDRMPLPIRHGEGKVFVDDAQLLERLEQQHCIACRYIDPSDGEPTQKWPHNPNGSVLAIAGICDPTGRVFGLMPHPEAYLFTENHPQWDLQRYREELPETGLGLKIFQNAVQFLREN